MRAPQLLLALALLAPGYASGATMPAPGEVVAFSDLPDFALDDTAMAFAAFRTSCIAAIDGLAPVSAALSPPDGLRCACSQAVLLPEPADAKAARAFFAAHFVPRRLQEPAFLTGYYEPVVEGSLTRTAAFTAPLLAEPATTRGPMPDRAAIESGALGAAAPPLVWLRAPVDAFFVAIQGSARVRLPDGTLKRLAYAGRNGQPYTAIGKLLVQRLGIPPTDMGMAQLRAWIEAHGQAPGEAGRALMDENRSFIFFRFDEALPAESGPVGAAGVGLTPLRSFAVDRTRWAYGLPVYVESTLPWRVARPEPFRRLMVAQDTGAAIVGPARADIFFGTGAEAATRAGPIRNPGTLWVLWPKAPAEQPNARGAAPLRAPKAQR